MDKNYFSDITDLFIKAKKAEKIDVNPHSKAAIREMLAYKVDEMKQADMTPEKGFFAKWKYQLVGVPASLFAVFMVVFAFQNLAIIMPKEDFAPEATEGSSMEQSEAEINIFGEPEIKDTPVIEEVTEVSSPKPKPELLVIDYGETVQPQTSTTPKTGGGYVPSSYTQPVVQPTETVEPTFKPYVAPVATPKVTVPKVTTPKVTSPTEIEPEETTSTTTPGVSTGGAFSVYTPTTEETFTPPSTNYDDSTQSDPTFDIYTPTSDGYGYTLISEEKEETGDIYVVPVPEANIPNLDMNPDVVNDLMQGNIPAPSPGTSNENKDQGSINEYRDPFNPHVQTFDTEALNTIEKPDTLDNVNVHYLNRDQAAVEVVDDNSTRWYMFETQNGTWKVTQKFD